MTKSARVLVVDDMVGMRESLGSAFRQAGALVDTAVSGREALRLIREQRYDFLITDLWMPDIDGISLIKELRERRDAPRIFAMTGGGPRLTTETASSIAEIWGAERVLRKPFDEDEFVNALLASI